jgi:hypothetical protein
VNLGGDRAGTRWALTPFVAADGLPYLHRGAPVFDTIRRKPRNYAVKNSDAQDLRICNEAHGIWQIPRKPDWNEPASRSVGRPEFVRANQRCVSASIDASSGLTSRHRLNRGGDRSANQALWRIVMVRMAGEPRTRAYVVRRTAEGRSKREIIRALKRYVARDLYRRLPPVPQPA